MQAFRAATTIDEERQLRLSDVPFSPGTAVDVIVLEGGQKGEAAITGSQTPSAGDASGAPRQRMTLAERQYRLAGQHPNEYVVLVGERIVHHCTDRQQAAQAYQRAAVDAPQNLAVIVSPGEKPRRPLLVRGRSLTAGRGGVR